MHRTPYLRQGRRWTLSLAFGALAALIIPTGAHTQALPPMQPTSLPPQAPGAPLSTAPPVNTPHHAEVAYAGGQLQVRADNSSLNQILRSISHRTGLKITGGVEEQRVFGNYGPGPISAVLATLLDGTNTNIFLLGGDATNPPELVLTQRSGGASPPEPSSPAYAMYDDSIDHDAPVAPPTPRTTNEPIHPQASVIPQAPVITATPSAPQPMDHPDANAPHAIAASPATPPATVPAATPDAKTPLTPEMVMQQLLKMQTQQASRKKELDDQIQKEQIEQQKKLKDQKPSSQTPTSPTPPQ